MGPIRVLVVVAPPHRLEGARREGHSAYRSGAGFLIPCHDDGVSTRMLILLAAIVGVAILAASAIQILLAR
jgi:hypothetical protein